MMAIECRMERFGIKSLCWIVLLIVFMEVLCEIEEDQCSANLICGEWTETVPMIVRGMPGEIGPPGMTGKRGSIGRPGLPGPPGRDGFTEPPISFFAALKYQFNPKNYSSILRPWKLSDSFNTPDVSHYFSHKTGIFTVPKSGLYQFFLTIAVSHAKASAHITKNGRRLCMISVESIATIRNRTIAWGWSSSSIDCLISCQLNDRVSAMAVYQSNEQFNSQIYGYSYSTFSGYKL